MSAAPDGAMETDVAGAWAAAVSLVLPVEPHAVLADSRYATDEFRDAVRQVAEHLLTNGPDTAAAVDSAAELADTLRTDLGLRQRWNVPEEPAPTAPAESAESAPAEPVAVAQSAHASEPAAAVQSAPDVDMPDTDVPDSDDDMPDTDVPESDDDMSATNPVPSEPDDDMSATNPAPSEPDVDMADPGADPANPDVSILDTFDWDAWIADNPGTTSTCRSWTRSMWTCPAWSRSVRAPAPRGRCTPPRWPP
ncbi:hypothetical protein NKH77_28845 [Streptomyces sp. M19]